MSVCDLVYVLILLEARGFGSNSARIPGSFEPPDLGVGKLKLGFWQELEPLLITEPFL